MRVLSFTMNGWVLSGSANFNAGNYGENNATKLEIITSVESGCTYSLDFMIGKMKKATAVLAVGNGVLSYVMPSTLTKALGISLQVVGTFSDGRVVKSNVIKCKLGESINAVETVAQEEASAFEQALATYAEKLNQAIASAEAASASETSAAASKDSAAESLASISELAANAAEYANTAKNAASQAVVKANAAEASANAAAGYTGLADSAKADAIAGAALASAKADIAKTYAEKAAESAVKAANAADIQAAIYTHNQSKTAHPDIVAKIPDVSRFITKSAEDLVWYYRKSQTYTKEEVNALISAVPKFSRRVVDALPTSDINETTIYLLQATDPQERNYFVEYIYVNDNWEIIGGQAIALTGYATETWVEGRGYLTEHQSLTGYATETWVEDQGYLTEHQSLTGYATESWVESQGYITQDQVMAGSTAKTYIDDKVGAQITKSDIDSIFA